MRLTLVDFYCEVDIVDLETLSGALTVSSCPPITTFCPQYVVLF